MVMANGRAVCLLIVLFCESVISFPTENKAPGCHSPLGLSVNVEPLVDIELSAPDGDATAARLHGDSAWRVENITDNTYLQVTLEKPMLIAGVQSQGDPNLDDWIISFKFDFSFDCETFTSNDRTYWGNLDHETTLTHFFHNMTVARCLRIRPVAFQGSAAALRLEVIGCDIDRCRKELSIYEKESLADGDQLLKFFSEKVLTSLQISYIGNGTVTADNKLMVFYSRTCANFEKLTGESVNPVIKDPGDNSHEQVIEIEFPGPVRAQCVQILPGGEFQPVNVKAIGCDTSSTEKSTTNANTCGKSRNTSGLRRKRVVGGAPVIHGDWPWVLSFHFLRQHNYTDRSGLRHLCGGSLIHPQWAISAAHCFSNDVYEGLDVTDNWRVALGENDQTTNDGTEQILEIEKIIKHERAQFKEFPLLYDIALIKLKQPAALSDYVNVICLDTKGEFPEGSRCTVAGWGQDTMETPGTKLPFKAILPIVNSTECREQYDTLPGLDVRIDDSVFCAASETGGRDACWGDSGGPFFCEKDDRWYQVGIVSIGYLCGNNAFPGIYTRISHYKDWIEDKMANN
ncbi:hypothetical protein SNE40_019610 [Patella caerulea]|uniref:Uncharacterized protein n=1 Tax=Patella caerulea TaxID=87958 RepID=A0AAN8P679_PATCE